METTKIQREIVKTKSEIKRLEERLKQLLLIEHNNSMNNSAKPKVEKLKSKATLAELKFKEIAEKKNLKLEFQYQINIYKGKKIDRYYIADFCDLKNRIIFEIDGGYHLTSEQKRKDSIRTKDLNRLGYKVFRVTNEEVLSGETTSFLYNVYSQIKN